MKKLYLPFGKCRELASKAPLISGEKTAIYGVPRGGTAVALLMATILPVYVVDTPEKADLIVDDIIDSGRTRHRYQERYPNKPFFALVDKKSPHHVEFADAWVTFPWEHDEHGAEETVEDNVVRLLQAIGENPSRDGLKETPARFVRAFKELTEGYQENPRIHLRKTFSVEANDEEGGGYAGIILSRDIPFVSLCEHHLLPFSGIAHIAYIPQTGLRGNGRVVGLSKLARLLDGYAKRLQVQERLTKQVAAAIHEELNAAAVGVIITGKHTCQCYRGVRKDGSMVTSAMLGRFMDSAEARAELLSLIKL